MTISTHTSVTSFDAEGDIHVTRHGAWSDATSDVYNVTVHDVASVTRHTRNGITTVTITDSKGGHMTVNCFNVKGEG